MKIPFAALPEAITNAVLGLAYPPRCQACGRSMALFSGGVLCGDCYNGIKTDPGGFLINTDIFHFDASRSVCVYEGAIRECIHKFKYGNRAASGRLFKKLMAEFAEKYMDMRRFDWLVPVPLHRDKEKERTFNQSGLLAIWLSQSSGVPVLNKNLVRVRPGRPQIASSKNKRISDIKGAFKVSRPRSMLGKTILLVDDVLTTGATANECSNVIKKAGADCVEVLTLARSV